MILTEKKYMQFKNASVLAMSRLDIFCKIVIVNYRSMVDSHTKGQWCGILFFCCLDWTTYQEVTSESPHKRQLMETFPCDDVILYKGCVDGLVPDCSNPIAYALELLQSYTKPSMFLLTHTHEQMFAAIVHGLPYSVPLRSHTGV